MLDGLMRKEPAGGHVGRAFPRRVKRLPGDVTEEHGLSLTSTSPHVHTRLRFMTLSLHCEHDALHNHHTAASTQPHHDRLVAASLHWLPNLPPDHGSPGRQARE